MTIKNPTSKTCSICFAPFTPPAGKGRAQTKTCGEECQAEHVRRRLRAKRRRYRLKHPDLRNEQKKRNRARRRAEEVQSVESNL